MTVIKSKRKESKIEVYYNAVRLKEEIDCLILRSFGIYSRNSPLRDKYSRLAKEDEFIFSVIEHHKASLSDKSNELISFISAANEIYPRTKVDYETRFCNQNNALATARSMMSELNSIVGLFDVDISVFRNVVLLLDRQISLLKRWKQKDKNTFKRQFL